MTSDKAARVTTISLTVAKMKDTKNYLKEIKRSFSIGGDLASWQHSRAIDSSKIFTERLILPSFSFPKLSKVIT
jgi:hypothetical protein